MTGVLILLFLAFALLFLVSAAAVIFPFKPFKSRGQAGWVGVGAFVGFFVVATIGAAEKASLRRDAELKERATETKQEPIQESEVPAAAPAQPAKRSGPAPIQEYALNPYTRDQFPDTFKKWGTKGVVRIEEVRKAAAQKIATSPSCDAVELVEISEDRSSPSKGVVVFADCTNGERFYMAEAQALDADTATMDSEGDKGKRVSATDARSRCLAAIKSEHRYPSGFSYWWYVTDARFVQTNGRWVVELIVPPNEALKMGVPRWATCTISPASAGESLREQLAVRYTDDYPQLFGR